MRLGLFLILILTAGCGNSFSCLFYGDNLRGRMVFTNGTIAQPGASIVAEYSLNGFGTVRSQDTVSNTHGLLTFEYTMCVDNNVDFQVRIFQDLDGDRTLDAGEASGRYDGTSNGNGAFITTNVPQTGEARSSNWNIVRNIDVAIDTP